MSEFPTTARAVIIGGGIVGTSTAYHLARLGWRDTVLLERHKLTSGSTFHAAGLVGQLRSNANITQLLGQSVALYAGLEAETGLATGWKQNGGLRLACTEARWTELKRQATTARSFGLPMHLLDPAEAKALWPLMDVTDVIGAAFLPSDGQANPSDITQSLAKGARMAGARIIENTEATGIDVVQGRAVAVRTAQGRIACETVIVCAGQWTRDLCETIDVSVPLVSVQHQYIVTEQIAGVAPTLPTLRDPDRLTYYKEEVGGLVMGGYEPNPIPWAVDGIPEGFNFQLLNSDWDHFQPIMELAIGRVPALETAGVKTLLNGPESFTPDGNFILGAAPELAGLFVGAGFNAFGIAAGGGAGKALAEWVAGGEPPYDLWPVDIRRFGRPHRDVGWVRARTLEAYARHYAIAWPHEEYHCARKLRRSPLYPILRDAGACFGEKLGWERPNWFAIAGEPPEDVPSFGRPNWFSAVASEHRATREAVALFDQSSFAKFEMTGRDAEAALSYICANDVRIPPGRLVYTQMLNAHGGIECDLTVARLGPERFYIVTGTGFATRDFDWIARHIPSGADATLHDVTSGFTTLSLMGPRARDVLSAITRDDVSNDAFRFGAARVLHVAGAPVRAMRVTYVGELGWEMHVPTEFAVTVYEALMAAGARFGIVNAGYRTIESLRLEKFYRAWGADIGPDHTPLEAGLGWAVKDRTCVAFLGDAAIRAQRAGVLRKRLCGFTVDDPSIVLIGRETIYRDGEPVGWLSSGGFGHTVGVPIGYGYVRHHDGVTDRVLHNGTYALDIATQQVPCRLHLAPLYDPAMARVKA
ncbi:FAD-dependent oxidoreductase [Acidiphilium sp. AL]|uniref:FAD-dependent oxidoreductase n=1 Tax=Acidiphilium iwatense TaxID=768198 RepID=A0ABS9DZW6_9PROT|nr:MULTISPECIES: FAD-dependent oxidoreductase [Acidiphilium]MCF3947690.1 FAD-dependent oxidoreductase [Acidiphilium iwatense]MCU4161088.1 FAD-dependent oxidoreductase [Acidiphilium sp. AL]